MAALKENPAHGGSRGQADISKHFALDRTVPTLRLLPLLEAIWGRGRGKARDTVALADAMHAILAESGQELSKQELSALFRSPGHKNFQPCTDQVLRAFIKGLIERVRAR